MRWCSARGCTFTPDELPLVSSGRTLVAFDVCFFATYAVGWFVTAVFNRGGLEDNGIARVFRVYNICIGVDTMPARLVCIPLSYLSIFFFMLTVILAAHRVTYEPGVWKALRLLLLLTAMLLATMFTWSIGIEPVGVENMRLHVTGFGLGLIGYGLLKLSSVLEFLPMAGCARAAPLRATLSSCQPSSRRPSSSFSSRGCSSSLSLAARTKRSRPPSTPRCPRMSSSITPGCR
mmetsp:Transcript_41526/g.135500  ORF Transcript_41526/g.135500 Transcript_41526/m.135500 type:complete len:233 (+) Transcript_41526:40-738(+)